MTKEQKDRLAYLGIRESDILLPSDSVDASRWAVVACDQFSSQKDYWHQVEAITADSWSTYNLIFPECYLEDDDREERIRKINANMNEYLASGIFVTYKDCFILVERMTESGTRYGLMAALDLENYSYAPDSRTLVRATEGTILSRIPPRKEIRKNAPLELPHIMVLLNDRKRQIIEPLVARRPALKCIYDTDLMLSGGHLRGYLIDSEEDIEIIIKGMEDLYRSLDMNNPILYAMGDGNHSLATAKSLYEDQKKENRQKALASPSRYALVELENIFDPALCFEAIHRVFFNTSLDDFISELKKHCTIVSADETEADAQDWQQKLEGDDGYIRFAVVCGKDSRVYKVTSDRYSLAASIIQQVIDSLLQQGNSSVDYIHGIPSTLSFAKTGENIAVILPDISKESFFDDIKADGAFPRKTFSIGHAQEKRYYMEARKIR